MRRPKLISRLLARLVDVLMPDIMKRMEAASPWKQTVFFPSIDAIGPSSDFPFMASSACVASDFFHSEFWRICELIGAHHNFHRKLWEWVFIVHHAERLGVLRPGQRGLVFGVGRELLPAAFAELGCHITATDAPMDVAIENGWNQSGQFSGGLAALPSGRLDRATFEERVNWRECDMNAIDPDLSDFDFCWSSCSLEHLGSLQAGLDFVINSVERTLKVGGVALHTTELNLSSNDATLDHDGTVLYRRRDLEGLIAELRRRGHEADELRVSPNVFVMNNFTDSPPYAAQHLLVHLGGFTTTSVGLVVRRGR
jgi:SAM-dependent methyltransferase